VFVSTLEVLAEVAEKERAWRHELTRDAAAHLAAILECAGGDHREREAAVAFFERPIVGAERASDVGD